MDENARLYEALVSSDDVNVVMLDFERIHPRVHLSQERSENFVPRAPRSKSSEETPFPPRRQIAKKVVRRVAAVSTERCLPRPLTPVLRPSMPSPHVLLPSQQAVIEPSEFRKMLVAGNPSELEFREPFFQATSINERARPSVPLPPPSPHTFPTFTSPERGGPRLMSPEMPALAHHRVLLAPPPDKEPTRAWCC